jgi:hypothetical protein
MPIESNVALAAEGCFLPGSPEITSFSATCGREFIKLMID